MKHKFITIGEIMLRLTPPDYEKIRSATSFEARYGGSEANVALSLANLGVDASFNRRRDTDTSAWNLLSGDGLRNPPK